MTFLNVALTDVLKVQQAKHAGINSELTLVQESPASTRVHAWSREKHSDAYALLVKKTIMIHKGGNTGLREFKQFIEKSVIAI